MRNLTKTLVAASLLTVTNAHSLGIGGIKLHSALNQNLNAEIALATTGENPGDISVKLAPPAKFDEAGVPWSYFLTKIKFKTLVKPNGAVVIKLTSNEALKEPFLDFLLEVSWPQGSMYREFTVLVDPPATYKQAVVPVINRDAEPDSVASNSPRNAESKIFVEPPVRQANTDKFVETEVVSEYGPVRKKDTLWSIASRVRTDEVTVAQMAMAIYEANPNAFAKPNVNTLIKGRRLTIPDPEVALKRSPTEALNQYNAQKQAWRAELNREREARRILQAKKAEQQRLLDEQANSQKAENPNPDAAKAEAPKDISGAVPSEPKPNNQLTLEPPVDEVVSGKTAVVANDGKTAELEQDTKAAAAAALKNQLGQENQNLEQRFERIEQQLIMMQKMLEIKDEQLAVLQNQQKLPVIDNSSQKLATLVPRTVPEVKPVTPVPTQSAAKEAPEDTAQTEQLAVTETQPVTKPAQAKPVPSAETAQSDPYADYYLIGGGLAASILGALGLLWWRQRKTEEDLETDMFAASSQIILPEDDVDEKAAVALVENTSSYDVGTMGESAFMSEFTPSEFDAFETSHTEIDPISEADVYLAYGRYQQAEDLIRQAMLEHPDRDDCKLKLLEIFHANENKFAFDEFVEELIAQGKQSDTVFWTKVDDMSQELKAVAAPSGTSSVADSALRTAAATAPINSLIEFDLTTFSVDDDLNALAPESEVNHPIEKAKSKLDTPAKDSKNDGHKANLTKDANDQVNNVTKSDSTDLSSSSEISAELNYLDDALDFDLDMFAAKPPVSQSAPQSESKSAENVVDFDLNSLSAKTKLSNQAAQISEDNFAENGLDFDLSIFSNEKPAPAKEAPPAEDSNSLDFDLTELSKNIDDKFDSEFQLNELDENQLDFDLSEFDTLQSPEPKKSDKLVKAEAASTSAPIEKSTLDSASLDLKQGASAKDKVANAERNDIDFSDLEASDTALQLEMPIDEEKLLEDYDFTATDLGSSEHNFIPLQEKSASVADEFDFDVDADGSGHFDVDDLTDGEGALETKINLANAYIDMGDIDTARTIAEELLSGSKEQSEAGRDILSKIS